MTVGFLEEMALLFLRKDTKPAVISAQAEIQGHKRQRLFERPQIVTRLVVVRRDRKHLVLAGRMRG